MTIIWNCGGSFLKNSVLLIAGHEMGIHGGGSTCAQIARAYTRADYGVLYVAPDSPFYYHEDGIYEIPLDGFDLSCWGDYLGENSVFHIAIPCQFALDHLEKWRGPTLYHCRDNWSLWTESNKSWDWWNPGDEQKIIDSVDVSFAVSQRLANEVLGNGNVLHNGYDPTVFSWMDRDPKPVEEVVTWGFSGGFFDEPVFRDIVEANQSINYTVIGRRTGLSQRTADLENIDFVGPVDMTELPSYAKEADAGIVVRESTGVPEYMDPIKSWEFLGSGLPFISVGPDYPNSEENPACKDVSSDPDVAADILKKVHDFIMIGPEDAENHTWDDRIEEILEEQI